ncbi:MAG: hypothetical protein K9H25_07795 [Rhodospirillum sp.]|nr:hypothetical protein [Rhodospirillum sp.]MCF8489759.1 hypothetical protein [Rhodospirillum sp.]MCF8501276.1 hypothetical protein [Rhodospirillum sp.]
MTETATGTGTGSGPSLTPAGAALLEAARSRGVHVDLDLDCWVLTANLVDGLRALDVPVTSNRMPWNLLTNGKPPRLVLNPEGHRSAALVLVEASERVPALSSPHDQPLFDRARTFGRDRVVLLNSADHANLVFYPNDLPVLTAHENRQMTASGQRTGWPFALSRTMMERAARVTLAERDPVLLRTFRPSLNQSLRDALDLMLIPALGKILPIRDGTHGIGRFQGEFYQALSGALGCLAYGGFFHNAITENPYFMDSVLKDNLTFHASPVILRWDSWRLWECFLTGTLAVTLDMDVHGMDIPVHPENWVHYVGLDLSNLDRDLARLAAERDRLPTIAATGRDWVLTHYTPTAQAHRFLNLMAEKGLGRTA